MYKKLCFFFVACALVSLSGLAQLRDDPNNNIHGTATRATGDVVTSFNPGTGGAFPVGLEHDGGGGLLITDIGDDTVNFMDLTGSVSSSFAGVGNPIGISTDGVNIYQTDTAGQQVVIFNSAGTQTGSFSVATETTFPEGITYNPNTGNLYVVSGSGENYVAEYTTAGTLVGTYPINGSSQDGIAFAYDFYWIYDSGTDLVRRYDTSFNEVGNFGGTSAAGFGTGEGLAVVGDVLYVCASGTNTVVGFDISQFAIMVPTLGEYGMAAFVVLLIAAGIFLMRRNRV